MGVLGYWIILVGSPIARTTESAFATGAGDIYPTDLSSLAQTLIDERFSTPTKEWLEARAKRNNHKERNDRKPPAFDEKKIIEGINGVGFPIIVNNRIKDLAFSFNGVHE